MPYHKLSAKLSSWGCSVVLSHLEQSASITDLINNMIHLRTGEVARKGGWFAYSSASQARGWGGISKAIVSWSPGFRPGNRRPRRNPRIVALRVRPMASLRFSYGLQPILPSRTNDFRRWFAIYVLSDPCVNNYKELQRFTSFAGYGTAPRTGYELLFLDRKVLYLRYSDFDRGGPRRSR